eukprot:12262053-Heterocapsa_arctica.AAC.1
MSSWRAVTGPHRSRSRQPGRLHSPPRCRASLGPDGPVPEVAPPRQLGARCPAARSHWGSPGLGVPG